MDVSSSDTAVVSTNNTRDASEPTDPAADYLPASMNNRHIRKPNAAQFGDIQSMMVQITTDGVPKLHCHVCNKALVSLNGYVKHMKKHEPPGGFFCRYCEGRFCTDNELKLHRDAVHTTIACRICKDVTFTNEQDYREHIRVVHNGIDRVIYTCDKCGAEYKTIDPFRRHMDTECGTIKPHKCEQCGMAFVTKYNLKQHKESHTGERNYCCSYCGKNFVQKGRLVEHERSHTGEKPYKCDVCGKCFSHRESIVTHSSIHTGIRLVECRCCLSRFSCYSNLIKHRRTRLDTCGQPEFDPPKNGVRTRRPRIPPTLNPTSEIKVNNMNKIIKPSDKEQVKKLIKKEQVGEPNAKLWPKVKVVLPPRKRIGGLCTNPKDTPKRRRNKKRAKNDTEEQDTDEEVVSNTNAEQDPFGKHTVQPVKRQTRGSLAQQKPLSMELKAERKPFWSDVESEEDFPDFDPSDNDSNDRSTKSELPLPMLTIKNENLENAHKQEQQQTLAFNVGEVDRLMTPSGFEYSDASQFVQIDFNVKSEDDANIFNERDNLLHSLLEDVEPTCGGTEEIDDEDELPLAALAPVGKMHRNRNKNVNNEHILQETEVIFIKNEYATTLQEEDVLEMKDLTGNEDMAQCKILLEDVKLQFPKLKRKSSVRVSGNANAKPGRRRRQSQCEEQPPRRKCRKRNETPATDTPKRKAKLSQKELKARMKLLKKEEKSWSCPYCIKIYYMRKPFEKHLRDDHRRTEDEIRDTFKEDDVGLLNENIFKCHICEKIYLMEKRLLAHIKLHGPDGALIFKCPCYCNVYFATKDEATAHAHTKHRDLLFCDYCQKYMTGHDSLKNHMRHHHSETAPRNVQRNLVCDKCGKKFSGRTSLTDHVRSDCGRVPLYSCNICGKNLTTAGILKTHLLLHKDETPYQCDKCGKTFKVKAQYKTHLKTRHTDFKAFKCHLCPKEYPYRESLLTHMAVHTGFKRFLCNGCGKRFTCISNLQAHRKVQADTCGLLPLNPKATQYMGVQKGNLLLGAKPEAGLDYIETNTLVAKEVIDRDLPMSEELNYPSEPTAPLATVPLNYSQPPAHFMPFSNVLVPPSIDGSRPSTYS